MTAKIIPIPKQGACVLLPSTPIKEYLPPGVRALLAIMEAAERKYGSIMPPKGMSPEEHVRDVAPYLA